MTVSDPLMFLAPLFHAAVQGDTDVVKSLIAEGADVNLASPHDQRTTLHLAAAGGHLDLVKYLVQEAGAEVKRDRHGMLPVHDAKHNGHSEVRQFLQEIEFKLEGSLGSEGHPFASQMDSVFGLVVRDGIFSYDTVQSEVRYFYNTLGMHPAYFSNFTAAQISRHIQCLLAAKKVAETRGERELQFGIEDQYTGFFLTTMHPSSKRYDTVQQCNDYLLESVRQKLAYSLTFMASEGPAFANGARAERLGIYIVDRTHWEGPQESGDVEETDLQRISTTRFLKNTSSECLAIQQKLVERAVATRSTVVEVLPGSAFPGPYPGGYVAFFAAYQMGGRGATPLFSDLQELLWHTSLEPKRYYVETFSNGAASYALYFPDATEAMVRQLQTCLRYIQHTKRTTGLSMQLWNKVTDGSISPDHSIYLRLGIKYVFSFFPRERYVPQYGELQRMLHQPESKQKLDELYLQTIREIITCDRIYEIVCKYIAFTPRFFADFKKIAHGEKPFWNAELAKEIEEKVRDPLAVQVLKMFVQFNQCVLITNFFRTDEPPSAIACRLNPEILLKGRPKSLYPEIPFGIYLVMGRHFHGFHVRFREIARGGVRMVRSRDPAAYNKNNSALFEECFNLAYTQQLKNKDIPEGGAKGVILLDCREGGEDSQSTSAGKDCFVKYMDCLLDCMLKPAGITSHCTNEELLFFGPDEGTADCMDTGAKRARDRGHRYWKALTTGKSVSFGGVPHDVYGITTRGVRTYVRELYRVLNLDEKNITKLQTGGPDGDLGSNEILQSCDKTIAVLDVSGVAYDPAGLNRDELERLARNRQQISSFNRTCLGAGGFLVLVGEENVELPDGSKWRSGVELRDKFVFTKYARADLFVPCGGRPATVNASNVKGLVLEGLPWKYIVEGANLFITEDARRSLEDAGVHLFKDSTANKGGVTSSSLEVLASLAMAPKDHDALMTGESGNSSSSLPDFYLKYVDEIIQRIEENCRDEFGVIWAANTSAKETPMRKIEASKRLSQEITTLQDHIAAADLSDDLLREVLKQALPELLIERCGLEALLERLPQAYVKATAAYWIASKYVYEHGVVGSNSFAFHAFMCRFMASSLPQPEF